jgi:G3E family GTPase
LRNTIEKDLHKNPSDSRTEEGLKDVYERLRPGEPRQRFQKSYHQNQILKHELMSLKEFYVYGQYEHMLHKNPSDSRTEEGLKDVYERLRPGEPKTADSSRSLLTKDFKNRIIRTKS